MPPVDASPFGAVSDRFCRASSSSACSLIACAASASSCVRVSLPLPLPLPLPFLMFFDTLQMMARWGVCLGVIRNHTIARSRKQKVEGCNIPSFCREDTGLGGGYCDGWVDWCFCTHEAATLHSLAATAASGGEQPRSQVFQVPRLEHNLPYA